jgi:penicillin amidase
MTDTENLKLPGAEAPLDIVWDDQGIPHVFALSVADAYRGMGYAAGRERLWQIHLSTAYANCEAAALLGERFVAQDAIQRACNVSGRRTGLPDSEGDWVVDAYLDGLNAVVDQLDAPPPEFQHAGAEPRHFTRADVAARYRFTSWFQHKSWTEKMALGRLMATHGIDWFKHHVLHFSDADASVIETLKEPLQTLSVSPYVLAYPEASSAVLSGSNNWAVTGALSKSGMPILATDPHQPHTIPNTFFYIHLHAPDWDAFGAAFPGVPYFMMGTTRDISWGLTTGFVDCYDVYIEQVRKGEVLAPEGWQPTILTDEHIKTKEGQVKTLTVERSPHGPLIEPLAQQLGLMTGTQAGYATALHWSLDQVPTSAGALARLPLARTAEEFGHLLFEEDVCPLVNNIVCVDRDNGLRRFIATTLPARSGVTGTVPLPGWDPQYDFPRSTEKALTVEVDPACGFALTANNDTMGKEGPFSIHNFPANSARADRIKEILSSAGPFDVDDFKRAQLDLTDLRAKSILPDLLSILADSDNDSVRAAHALLSEWDCVASIDAAAACVYYPFQDRIWARKFMKRILPEDPVIRAIPTATPGLSLFDIEHFLAPGNPWRNHADELKAVICETMAEVYDAVASTLGAQASEWCWGDLHQIQFAHRLAKHAPWQNMQAGPDPIGGSSTTLGMAMHMGPGPGRATDGEIPCRVYHGPAFRWVVDLADPEHVHFVIAGGNGGTADSPFATNQYPLWLKGDYLTVSFRREEISEHSLWQLEP